MNCIYCDIICDIAGNNFYHYYYIDNSNNKITLKICA